MSMKRYSADSCSVQYFQPYQQYKYVPECLLECLPEYENRSQCTPAVKTYLFPHDMPNPFFEAVQQQSWTSTDLEQNTSDWQMRPNNDNYAVARTSATASRFAVGFGTLQAAKRRINYGYWETAGSPGRVNKMNIEFNALKRAAAERRLNRRGGVGNR